MIRGTDVFVDVEFKCDTCKTLYNRKYLHICMYIGTYTYMVLLFQLPISLLINIIVLIYLMLKGKLSS